MAIGFGKMTVMPGTAVTKSVARAAAKQAEKTKIADDYGAEREEGRSVLRDISQTTVPGVTAAAVDPAFRDSQMKLLEQLTAQSEGRGPSLAQQQFQQAGNTALQKAMGAIRAATGTNAALGGRTAALASTNLLGNIAAESGMARLREQQGARDALAALAASGRTADLQGRQQDINLGTSNADIALKNLGARTSAAGGLVDETSRRYEGHYNRGAQIDAAKAANKGSSMEDKLTGAILQTGGTILAKKATGGVALTGDASVEEPTKAPQTPRNSPFRQMRRGI
jgi:hypothetical protein